MPGVLVLWLDPREIPQTFLRRKLMATKTQNEIQENSSEDIKNDSKPIDGDELALPISENMPEPSPSALKGPEEQPANIPLIKDSEGVQFDPSIHRTDDAGNPRISPSTGKFLKKYKATSTASPASTIAPQTQGTAAANDQFDNGAEMLLQTGYGVAASFLSNDIRPENAEEHASLKIPLAAVLRERGSLGMTPTQLLMLSLAAYIGKKAAKPTVKERLLIIYLKARAFIKGEKQPTETPKIEPTK
jgi:hypothetical protein